MKAHAVTVFALAVWGVPSLTVGEPARQPVTVEDLVRFATIGDPLSLDWNDIHNRIAAFSPNGERVAVVVRRGNPEQSTNDATLVVYRTADLFHDARAETVAEFASASNAQPIAYVRWLADNETLVFAGTRGELPSQVYRFTLWTRELDELTRETAQLLWYDVTPSGDRLVTVSERRRQPPAESLACKRSGCRVTADTLYEAQNGLAAGSTPLSVHDLRSGKVRRIPNPEATDATIEGCTETWHMSVSPDGRFALRVCVVKVNELPVWWGEYTADRELPLCWAQRNNWCYRRIVFIDLESGASVALSDAPYVSFDVSPLWIDGGRRVIFPGALEPLTGIDADERPRRAATFAVLLADPLTRETTRVAWLDTKANRITAATWDQRTQTLVVETEDADRNALPVARFRRDGARWSTMKRTRAVAAADRGNRSPGMDVVVEQSLNDRPVLVAVNQKTGAKRRVLDPNLWLDDRRLGRVEAVTWQSKDGSTWRGGLYYPPNFTPGVRYPLLLQTHGFESKHFSLHGIARNFAAQAVAAHGIAVLQVDENYQGLLGQQAEWSITQAGHEGAIDHLDRLGIIDPHRVGMQGWSRTGTHVGYMLTHSAYPVAAAALTATADIGWLWYLSAGAPPVIDSLFGAAPFDEGLKRWSEYSPTFNLGRVRTPMLLWGEGSAWVLWDWHAGLRRLGKPVEYWISPEGTHDVFQVGQRIKSNQLLVDWFRFWLKGEEDADLAKADQYRRWRQLRQQHEADRVTLESATNY